MYNKDNTIKDAKNTAINLRDEAIDTAYDVKDELRDAANKTGKKVRSFFNTASDDLSQVADSASRQIRKNPVQTSLVALAAGFVLGALFRS
jgi:ElaB/YqjD/DUF883 family membrane-anchored ribosome-binding protein